MGGAAGEVSLKTCGEGAAEVFRKCGECDELCGGRSFEDVLDLAGDLSAFLITEHAEGAGELVGYAVGLEAGGFGDGAGGGD